MAGLILATLRGMRTELRGDIARVRDELPGVRHELRGDIRALDHRMRAVDDRMRTQERSTAKLEGLLEGLREAVVARAGSWSGTAAGLPVRRAAGGSEPAPG